jgi:hypothetical protein
MSEIYKCPDCGRELTMISLEIDRLQRQGEEVQRKLDEIIQTVFDADELGSISDRRDDE